MAELQKVVGIDLEGQTNPGSLAKCKVRVSTDLPLAQRLPCPKKQKCQGQTFHAEPGCTLCSCTGR